MKRITLLLLGVATLSGVVVFTATTSRHVTAQEAAPVFVKKIPPGRWSQWPTKQASSTIFVPFWGTT